MIKDLGKYYTIVMEDVNKELFELKHGVKDLNEANIETNKELNELKMKDRESLTKNY